MFSTAQTPIEPKKSDAKKILGALLGLALFLSIAVAVAMDLIDQRIVSPAEVKRAIGFPPVGIVLEQTHGTLAFADEHFRRLVNGIQRGMASQEAKCIVLTPLSDARNSGSLVSDIGRALLARGLKTIIVDANPGNGDGRTCATLAEALRAEGTCGRCRVPARIDMGASQEISRIPVVARVGSLLTDLRRETKWSHRYSSAAAFRGYGIPRVDQRHYIGSSRGGKSDSARVSRGRLFWDKSALPALA